MPPFVIPVHPDFSRYVAQLNHHSITEYSRPAQETVNHATFRCHSFERPFHPCSQRILGQVQFSAHYGPATMTSYSRPPQNCVKSCRAPDRCLLGANWANDEPRCLVLSWLSTATTLSVETPDKGKPPLKIRPGLYPSSMTDNSRLSQDCVKFFVILVNSVWITITTQDGDS